MLIGLDFETYGSVDLPKHGMDRYMADQHFRPLIACMYYEHNGSAYRRQFDFVNDPRSIEEFKSAIRSEDIMLVGHNVAFELAVLKWMGIEFPLDHVIDSAVCARIAGGSSHLEAAAPQLLGVDKLAEGRSLIRLFSIPGKYQEESGSKAFTIKVVDDHHAEWKQFLFYCSLDAELSYKLATNYPLSTKERSFQQVTLAMNMLGWHVDVKIVEEMHRRYLENLEFERDYFARSFDRDLNLNSLPQLKKWCADRGIKAYSFDEKNVARLVDRISEKLQTGTFLRSAETETIEGYQQVLAMLRTKQVLGGSSLKKLQVILDTVSKDGRLRDQYQHCGAGQSLRTTGRSVQMQNLKRLGQNKIEDMEDLLYDENDYDNDVLAENMRQVFTATNPNGSLIVGDFKSVESRGLAWLAHEEWKLDAYRKSEDLYVLLAERFGKTRQFGKVGELSCGYQAGPGAVRDFAAKMGMPLSEGEASSLVYSWREACPRTVEFWYQLDDMLHQTIALSGPLYWELSDGFRLRFSLMDTPRSLRLQAGDKLPSLEIAILDRDGDEFLRRVFLGVHKRGRNVVYFKPSNRKTGDLWTDHYTDPKTKKVRFHEIYGGKLAGILTQSFCRELFFMALKNVHDWTQRFDNINLVGQFHDEIVLDWAPTVVGDVGRDIAMKKLEELMSAPGLASTFPLEAEVKHDYRYTK